MSSSTFTQGENGVSLSGFSSTNTWDDVGNASGALFWAGTNASAIEPESVADGFALADNSTVSWLSAVISGKGPMGCVSVISTDTGVSGGIVGCIGGCVGSFNGTGGKWELAGVVMLMVGFLKSV
jgi:hypothetical protein